MAEATRNRKSIYSGLLTEFILERHQKHKVWGYHSIATSIQNDTGWKVSDNLVHKCCKAAGVKSKAKRYKYQSPLQALPSEAATGLSHPMFCSYAMPHIDYHIDPDVMQGPSLLVLHTPSSTVVLFCKLRLRYMCFLKFCYICQLFLLRKLAMWLSFGCAHALNPFPVLIILYNNRHH